jgi:hypothetical protein
MAKKLKPARVTIDIPDENRAMLCRETGETEPTQVVEAVLREWGEKKSDA